MNLTIGDIIKACSAKPCYGLFFPNKKENPDASPISEEEVTSVVLDSRLVTEGGVFIAQKGEKVDGHSFIGQVFEKGAALVITEKTPDEVQKEFGTDQAAWGNYILVKDSLIALKKIAKAYRDKLDIPVVGITGSVGKTSTKEFIAGVLSEKYKVLKTEGNFNNEIGVPLTLLRIRPEHEIAVVEMGISNFGEMTRLSEMAQPDIAVITNIGQCHLENLGTRDGILKAKTEIFKNMRPDGRVCLFGNDDKLITVKEVNGRAPYYFAEQVRRDVPGQNGLNHTETNAENNAENNTENNTENNIEVSTVKNVVVAVTSCEDLGLEGSNAKLLLNMPEKGISNETISVKVPLPGHHMVINSAAAATVSMLMGLKPEEIVAGIENMKPISGRNSVIKLKDMLLIDDCYNANPVSMKSSIELLKLAKGDTVAILGDMFELGTDEKDMHADVGNYAAYAGVNYIYCVGALSKNMYDAAVRTSAIGTATATVKYFETRDKLIEAIRADFESGKRAMLPTGSNVLVKASHGMHFEEVSRVIRELDA